MSEKELVIQALKATLISVKGALSLKQCNRDYRELQGEWIPFKKLGYPSLEKLFMDVPGFKLTQSNNEWYVDAIATEDSQHIAAMVAKQKPSKKSKGFQNRIPKMQSWRKPASYSNYTSNYSNQYSKQFYRAQGAYNRYSHSNNNNVVKGNSYKYKPTEQKHNYLEKKTSYVSEPKSNIQVVSQPVNKPIVECQPEVAPKVKPKQPAHATKHPKKKEEKNTSSKMSATQRLMNFRDKLNTVDEITSIPLQMPATRVGDQQENVGIVTEVTPVHNLEPPPDSTSSVAKLEWTCHKLGLPHPVYKVHDYKPKKGPVVYDCSVKVGTYASSSYPESAPSADLAQEVAALKLLALVEGAEVAGLPVSAPGDALSLLADLVAEHEAGLWANTVPHLYREKYSENLPSNWQELLDSCPRIIKDKVVNGLLVLLPKNEEFAPVGGVAPVIRGDETDWSELPPLQFPDDSCWNVYVTVANSTIEVWLRIIGDTYNDALEQLLLDMSQYYGTHGTTVHKTMIILNAWYAVRMEDGGWQRAKILELNEDNTATIFLGDHGDDDVVSLQDIKILEPQFRKLPAQAILCRLEGLEELAGLGAEPVARLVGAVLVATPGLRADPADPAVPATLYDTSTATDLDLNRDIVDAFVADGAFTLSPGWSPDVEVGGVAEDGRVWLVRGAGAAAVRAALSVLTSPGPYRRPLPASLAAPPPHHQHPHPLFIVRTLHGDWVRCKIISELDGEGTVRTQLVDTGLIMRAPLSSLVPLQNFSPALNAYPYQAKLVRLELPAAVAARAAPRLRALLADARVLVRVGRNETVQLYVRSGPHGLPASVTTAILLEAEIQDQNEIKTDIDETGSKIEALTRKKERIFRSNSSVTSMETAAAAVGGGVLPAPALPAPGQCIDVYIAMAANPWNFVVQPNSTRRQLLSMMASLQKECPSLSEAPAAPATGELYTVYYEKDSSWYRVLVAGTVSSEMVSVYFCDYGDLALFPTTALRPVPPAVPLATTLPPQAIKARLYNVYPLHQDWTVEDCIRFQELCVEQQFVGVCKSVGKDPLNPNEPLLTLDLIDTSTEADVFLNKLLVSEGRARLGTETT